MHSGSSRSVGVRTSAWLLLVLGAVAVFWVVRIAPIEGFPALADLLTYHYPTYQTFYGAIAEGRLPLWNPHQLTGKPWLAALQAGAFYPSHVLYLVLDPAVGMAASTFLHLFAVGASAALLLRRAGAGWVAGVLAAVLCALHGKHPTWVSLPNALEAAAWLGPGAIAVYGLARGGGRRDVALLAVATGASLLAGFPQVTVYAVYAWGLLGGLLLLFERSRWQATPRVAVGLAAGLSLGALLAAAQLLPALGLAAEGTRHLDGLPVESLYPMGGAGPASATAWRALGRWGWPAALLFPFALLLAQSAERRALAWAAVITGLVAVGFVAGPGSPLFDGYRLLPLLDSFRVPPRMLFVSDFCFGVAAGLGLDAARRRIAGWVGAPPLLERAGAALALVLALGWVLSGPALRIRLPYSGEGYTEVYHREQDAFATVAAGQDRVLFWNPGLYPELPAKLATVYGLRSVDDYEPANLLRHAQYFGFLAWGTTEPQHRPYAGRLALPRTPEDARDFSSRRRLLDLAAVRYVLAPKNVRVVPAWQSYKQAAGLRKARPPSRSLLFLESPNALPRAFVTHRILTAPPAAELLPLLARPEFDPRHVSYVEGDAALPPTARPRANGTPAIIVREHAHLVEIEATLPAPGLLVLADAYYTGWVATVDGRPARIYPTNHLFRGVLLPAGRHRVRFEYDASRLLWGAAGSAIAALAIAFLAFGGSRGRKRRRGTYTGRAIG